MRCCRCGRRVHGDFRGIHGSRFLHGELMLGNQHEVGYHQVPRLMRRSVLQGLSGRTRRRNLPNLPSAIS